MNKKILILVICFLFTFISDTNAITLDNSTLNDIDMHWSENDITTLYRIGILKGTDNMANPQNSITRGEFTALVARALNLKENSSVRFYDVPENHIFYNEVSALSSYGAISGRGDGNFYPSSLITREEIMLIISRCISENANTEIGFSDIKPNYKYLKSLKTAVSSGIISGYSDNTFKPWKNATRAEAAAMTVRLIKNQNSESISNIKNFSKKYIKKYFENNDDIFSLSTGTAYEEIKYIKEIKNLISENGAFTEASVYKLNAENITSDGILSRAEFSGNITYTTHYPDGTLNDRDYYCKIIADIISKNSSMYVYNFNLSLKEKNKINLTWEVFSTPPDKAPEGINVISPSSFQISKENLEVDRTEIINGIGFYNSLTYPYMNFAVENNLSVWPLYKTDFKLETSNTFLNSADARKKAIQCLIKYSVKYKTDGVNIDFENIYESNRALLTKHIREVTLAMHELGIISSADITKKEYASSVWSMCFDRDAIGESADYLMIMAYDQHYASSPSPGSVAALDWTENTIKVTLNEVPSDKLILGIPYYMRYWEIINGKIVSTKAISMFTAKEMISNNTPVFEWRESEKQYKIYWEENGKTCMFWLENADTVTERINLARKYNLAGIASWRRGFETPDVSNAAAQYLS